MAVGHNRGYARFRSSFQSLPLGVCRSSAFIESLKTSPGSHQISDYRRFLGGDRKT